MSAYVTGIGWVTSAGKGCGRQQASFHMPHGPLPKLTRKSLFDAPDRNFGRMDEYSRLGLAAVTFALRDAGLETWQTKRDIGIIATTCFGCLHTDIEYYDTVIPQGGCLASPNLFAYTLPNCFLGEAAIRFGLTGTAFVTNAAWPLGPGSLQMALESLACEESETMLAGYCDLGRPEVLKECEPVPPGAVFVVLEKTSPNGSPAYGRVDTSGSEDILLDAKPVNDLVTFVQHCLENRKQEL